MRTLVGRPIRKLEIIQRKKINHVTVNVHSTILLLEIQCYYENSS